MERPDPHNREGLERATREIITKALDESSTDAVHLLTQVETAIAGGRFDLLERLADQAALLAQARATATGLGLSQLALRCLFGALFKALGDVR